MADTLLRLRINYTKQGRLRFLSHLEMTRALMRLIRRADLPFAVSMGFNAHMKFASGPALPVGTEGLDEYFDVHITSYVNPAEAMNRLRAATVDEISILSAEYVDTKARGLQATHIYEKYRVIVESQDMSAKELEDCLHRLIEQGELVRSKKGQNKHYDLSRIIADPQSIQVTTLDDLLLISMELRAGEEGSIRPENLLEAALGPTASWHLRSVTRVRLAETSCHLEQREES